MGKELRSFLNIRQLPPIARDDDNHLLDHPHVFLNEVMRQAQESEIIRLSMDIRAQKRLPNMKGKEVQILNRSKLTDGMLQWADQILVSTNKTRLAINRHMRELKGTRSDMPEDGDKLICLRNYWGVLSNEGNDLINGTIGILDHSNSIKRNLPKIYKKQPISVTTGHLVTDYKEKFSNLSMDTHMIITGEKCVDLETAYKISRNKATKHLIPYEFTYGYAITTHKAQGSQWPKVLIIEERFPFDKDEHARWLYTSFTRAEEKVVLLR